MPVTEAPDELEVKDFYFKQVIKFRVHSSPGGTENKRLNVLAVSNKYGFTFVGNPTGFLVYKTSDISRKGSQMEKAASTIIEDMERWSEVSCKSMPLFVTLSSDDLTLAVCFKEGAFVFAQMYDVRAFATKDAKPSPFLSVNLSSKESDLADFAWNPSADFSSMFVSCTSDGDLALWEVKDTSLHVVARVPDAGATCVCWSPKGKQVAVGKQDGSIVQFDHQLKVKKVIQGPTGLNGDPVKVLDLLWQSTHVFMAAFVPRDESNTEPPCLVVLSVPKGEEPKYLNYDDVCYGGADDRKHRYYFVSLAEWDMVIASSASAAESAVIGRNAQSSLWERWSLDDSGRAEMPLSDDHSETYPLGIAMDFTQQEEILISDTMRHPPSPLFMALSTDGILVVYHMINKQANAKQLNTPAQPLTNQGERKGLAQPAPPAPAPSAAPAAEPPKFTAFFGGTSNVAKPPGVATAATTPSSGFSFGGQPTISFAKPAAQISAAGAQQKVNFSFKPTEMTDKPSVPFGGSIPPTSKPAEPALSAPSGPAAPAKPLAMNLANSAFSLQKPTAASEAAKTAPFAPAVKPPAPADSTTTPQVNPLSINPMQQRGFGFPSAVSAPPASLPSAPHSAIGSVPPATALPPRGIAPNQGQLVETSAVKAPAAVVPPIAPQVTKPEASVAPVRSPTKRSVDGAVENPFVKSIMDEIRDFNHELLEMKKRSLMLRVDIGSKEEQTKLQKQTNNVSEFCGDIKLTMKSLNEDIHSLKSDCLEGFALIEECTARQQKSNDPRYQQLLASRALDPLSAKRMKEVRTQLQYVDSSIRDVDGRLDEQWEKYMNRRNQNRKMYVPMSDTIYQTIKNNHGIYSNQCKLLDQLSSQLQELKVSNKSSWQSTPTGTPGGRFGSLSSSPMFSPAKKSYSPQVTQSPKASPLSPEKSARLREYLGKRRVTPIKATAPANLSMSKIAAAESLRHSLLEDSSTPPFSPEVSTREQIISNDFRADLTSSTPLRPITTGARQIGTEPQSIPTAALQRLTEGFQRIPEGSTSPSQGVPMFGGKTIAPSQIVKDAPNGAAAKPNIPSFQPAAANMPKPVFSFGPGRDTGTSAVPSGITGTNLTGLPKPPAEGSAAVKPPPSSNALTMILRPGAPPAPVTMATSAATRTTTAPSGFSFGITTGIAKPPAAGFTFSASAGTPAGKPADKPAAPTGSYKPTVEDITPPGTPPVEREDPEGFQQDDEHIPTVRPKPAKPDLSNNMLKNLLVGAASNTAATKTTSITTTTASLTSHPSRSLFTVGAESGSSSDFVKTPPTSATRLVKFTKGPAGVQDGSTRVMKNLFGTASGGGGVSASGGTDSGPVSFSIASKAEGSGSESTSPSPQQLEDEDAAEGQDAAAGSAITSSKPSTETVATTTAATSGFSFTLGAPSTGTTSPAGFSFKPPGGQAAGTSFFGGISKAPTSVFGGASSTQPTSFATGVFGGKFGSDSSAAGSTTSTAATTSATSTAVSSTTPSSAAAVSVATAVSDVKSSAGVATTAATSSSASGFVFSTTSSGGSTTTAAASTTPTSAPGFSFIPTGSLFGKSASGTFGAADIPPAATTARTATVAPISTEAKGGATASFGASTAAVTSTTAPASSGFTFGSTTPSAFGGSSASTPAATTSTTPSTTTANTSAFGGTTSGTTTASVFGGASTTSTQSLFGGSTASTGTTPSLFGGATPSTTAQSTFGGVPSSTTATPSIFGGVTSSTASSTSMFGGATTAAATSSSASVFGGGGQTSGFGAATTAASTFGGAGSSVFGGATTTQSAFGTSSAFGQPSSQPSSTFGQSGGVFGTQAPSSGVFGATTAAPSSSGIFGQTTAANSSSGGVFGGSGGGGGGLFSGLGGKPSAENANKNVFGGNVSFGAGSSSDGGNALFGQQGGQSFGQSSGSAFGGQGAGPPGGAFGSPGGGSFSSANQGSIATAGFGGFQTPPRQTGSFGGQPAFGGGATFGGTSPTFGGGAVFGSSPPQFGGGMAQPSGGATGPGLFGAAASSNQGAGGFAGFASAQAPSFGALASSGPGFGGGASQGFGDMGAQPSSMFGGGGGQTTPQNQGGFGSPGFGNSGGSPAFSAYRG